MTPEVKVLGWTLPAGDLADEGIVSEPLDLIEYAGRWDYGPKSIAKMGDRDIIRRWIGMGHESMLEMVDVVFLVTCSRVVSHELVRHRMASYQQESQRYVRYEDEDPADLFFVPAEIEGAGEEAIATYWEATQTALEAYQTLKELGLKSQIARYVLPNATRTRITVKMNLRELRHVLRLRLHSSAQPEMQVIANQMHDIVVDLFPEVFSDIKPWLEAGERAAR